VYHSVAPSRRFLLSPRCTWLHIDDDYFTAPVRLDLRIRIYLIMWSLKLNPCKPAFASARGEMNSHDDSLPPQAEWIWGFGLLKFSTFLRLCAFFQKLWRVKMSLVRMIDQESSTTLLIGWFHLLSWAAVTCGTILDSLWWLNKHMSELHWRHSGFWGMFQWTFLNEQFLSVLQICVMITQIDTQPSMRNNEYYTCPIWWNIWSIVSWVSWCI